MVEKDTRHLFIDLDRVRRWDTGIYQRFPKPEKIAISGLEPGDAGSCDARLTSIYGSVLKEGNLFRMWYGAMPDALSHDENPDHFYTAYAESEDGIHWRKPDLKITGQEKYPGNNLLSLPGVCMGVVPALPGTNAKYLAAQIHGPFEAGIDDGFGYEYYGQGTEIFASDDGLHWRQHSKTIIAAQGDVACLVVDPICNRYLLYQKVGLMHGLDMRRAFICMESTDGVNWQGYDGAWRESFVCDDFDDLQAMQAGFRIADHYGVAVYRAGSSYVAVENIFQIGSPLRFEFAQNPNGLCMFRLGYSHNGINWRRPKGRPVWMQLGAPGEFDAGFAVPSNTFIEHNDELLLYYGGSRFDHGWSIEENFELKKDVPLEAQRDSARVGLVKIRKDRFASLAATYKGRFEVDAGKRLGETRAGETRAGETRAGETRAGETWAGETWAGETLFVNALCPKGSLRVAIAERGQGTPLPGFNFDDCIAFCGDKTRAPIQFKNAQLADVRADKYLTLHFEIERGEIFGYEWGEQTSGK